MQGGLSLVSDNWAVAAPGANTDILSTALTPSVGGYYQVYVVLATSSVFNMTETRSSTTITVGLNNSTSLDAGDGYSFTVPVSPSSTYNFRVETDGIIRVLRVYEVSTPATVSPQGFQA